MAGATNMFQVSAPDATCSLAFTANVKSLLSNQYAQMELPPSEVLKLEGPATIEGDTLIVAIFNRTDWHVSEVVVALTVVKKRRMEDGGLSAFGDSSLELRPVRRNNPTRLPHLSDAGSRASIGDDRVQCAVEDGPCSWRRVALGDCAGKRVSTRELCAQRFSECDQSPSPA